jgi:predicted metal-binding protein
MKTEVTMQRKTFGEIISQKSKSGFFSATELERAGNKFRVMNDLPFLKLNTYFSNSANKEFIKELEAKYGKVKTDGRGKGNHIWVHPLLFLDIALWIDPKMKVEVYEWLMDNLLQFRNDSGESYNRMCGALFSISKNKSRFNKDIQIVARLIRTECDVKDWNTATEQQLKLRDKMHEFISLACCMVKDGKDAVRIGIMKAKDFI